MSRILNLGIPAAYVQRARQGEAQAVVVVACAALFSIKILWNFSLWTYNKILNELLPRVVLYGCVENNEKIVSIFSRCIGTPGLKKVAKLIIDDKNDLALSNLLKFSPSTSAFFDAAFEKPQDMIMNCKIIKYLRDTGQVDMAKICELVNLCIQHGAKFYSFANEGLFVSDLFNAQGLADVSEPVSGWSAPLLCIAAAENNLVLAKDLIARGASRGELRYHHEYDMHLYPFEFAAQYYHFEMVDLLSDFQLDNYTCKPSDFMTRVVQDGRLVLLAKLVSKGVQISHGSDFVHLVMQKLIEQHDSLSDEKFKEVMDLLLPHMLGHFSTSWTNTIEFSKAASVLLRAKRCGAFNNIDAPIDCNKGTLLQHAVRLGRKLAVQTLIDQGAMPTLADASVAKSLGHSQVVDILLRKIVQLDKTLLAEWVKAKDAAMVYRLLRCGAEVPDDEAFIHTILNLILFGKNFPQMSDEELIEMIKIVVSLSRRIAAADDHVFLFLTNNPRNFKLLSQCDVLTRPVHRGGFTLAHWAALRGHANVMRQLISMKAKLDGQLEDFRTTPLYFAVFHGHKECVSMLSVFPQLVQITSVTTVDLPDGRVAHVEFTPFDLALGIPRFELVDVMVESSEDPVTLFDPLYKALEQAQGHQLETSLFLQLRKAIKKSPSTQNNLRSLVLACENFIESEMIDPELIKHFAGHRSFIPFFHRVGYDATFVPKAKVVLQHTFSDSPIGECFMSYGDLLIEKLEQDPENKKRDAIQFKEACLALRRMYPVFQLETPDFVLPLLQQIDTIASSHSLKMLSGVNFLASFDERDGSIVVGEIFVAMDREKMTKCCRDAYAMGLSEGRDFRTLGIDDNLTQLSKIAEQGEDVQSRLEAEIDKKQALLERLQKSGVLSNLPLIINRCELSEIRKWEFNFNIHLLEWVLAKKDRILNIKEERKVEAVSQIKTADIISLLL